MLGGGIKCLVVVLGAFAVPVAMVYPEEEGVLLRRGDEEETETTEPLCSTITNPPSESEFWDTESVVDRLL